jgi:CHRD domain
MRRIMLAGAAMAAGLVALASASAHDDHGEEFSARLNGFNELGTLNAQTGAILSDGTGTVKLDLDKKTNTINYTLTYSNVGMTSPLTGTVTQAHIHFGKSRDSGGVIVYFCTNLPFTGHTGPTPPPCPNNSGTVKGTFTAMNVQAIPTQNVNAGDFDALVDVIASNTAYANIHTTALTAGEIRGQCRSDDREHQEHHGDWGDR